jgi:hypothetical protein
MTLSTPAHLFASSCVSHLVFLSILKHSVHRIKQNDKVDLSAILVGVTPFEWICLFAIVVV